MHRRDDPGVAQTGWTVAPLFTRRVGRSGPVVVLLHGLGASSQYWGPVAEGLAEQARVICPDLLGFGRSPWPEIEYRVSDHLDALDAGVLSARPESEPVILAGHSLGAILALAWIVRRPRRFSGLVLLGLPCYRSLEEAHRHIARLSPLAYATVAQPRLGAVICGLMCFGRPFWRLVAPLLLPEVPAEVARDGVLHTWRSYRGTLNHCILDVDIRDLAGKAAATGLRVRLLHGELDREAPPQAIRDLAKQTGWQLELLPGASHGLPVERPRHCADAIRKLALQGWDSL
jgi:pimeloyl-ACP methyl ester carboxylesterase